MRMLVLWSTVVTRVVKGRAERASAPRRHAIYDIIPGEPYSGRQSSSVLLCCGRAGQSEGTQNIIVLEPTRGHRFPGAIPCVRRPFGRNNGRKLNFTSPCITRPVPGPPNTNLESIASRRDLCNPARCRATAAQRDR